MPVRCFPDWDSFEIGSAAAGGPVAFSGDLSPDSVLSAYRHGIVPLPAADEFVRTINEVKYEEQVDAGLIGLVGDRGDDPYWASWWSPDPRPVIGVSDVHLGRNVRKQLRRDDLWTTADRSFQRVAEECRADREPRWLTDRLLETMTELHRDGWAHSIEVWQDDDLIGGALGVGIGRTLSGDSMFSRRPNAARIAVGDMAARFAQAGGLRIDAQWDTPFLRSLGAEPLPRNRYLRLLADVASPAHPADPAGAGGAGDPGGAAGAAGRRPLPAGPLPARRLIEPA
jgi:leucyl/phenylalanyl-tRNA---protein transferase